MRGLIGEGPQLIIKGLVCIIVLLWYPYLYYWNDLTCDAAGGNSSSRCIVGFYQSAPQGKCHGDCPSSGDERRVHDPRLERVDC